MKYNKLIRDKIPEILENKGVKFKIHIAKNKEYWEKLKEKLGEEFDEFKKNEDIEEMADIIEVIDAICVFKKFGKKKLIDLKNKKLKERGGFKKKIILEES
jgi:predicted house-cleaning noncanonical NTP pyrophosphatase (MazG superfamily)